LEKNCKTSGIKKIEKKKEKENLTICYHFNFGHQVLKNDG
jgi:hypothetical protein